MKTVRRPPYPKWNPGYFPCSSLTPLPLSSRRPSVSFGGFGLRRRRDYHRGVGEAIEALFPDRTDELAPRLAHHFTEARVADKALRYYKLAGDAAMRLYANAEAARHYGEALQLALQQDAGGETLSHIYRNLGRAMELNGQFDEAIDNYAEMEGLAHERSDRALELAALAASASVHATQSPKFDPHKAKADSDRALTLARDLKDREAESKILWNLMMVNMQGLSNPQQAVAHGEESLAIARQLGLREQTAYTLSDLGWAHAGVSKLEQGTSMLSEARDLWTELGNLPMLSNNLSVASWLAYMSAEYEVSISNSIEALEISRSIDNILYLEPMGVIGRMDLGNADRTPARSSRPLISQSPNSCLGHTSPNLQGRAGKE